MTTPKIDPKYPHIEVQLTGEDGNAFFIIGRVQVALRNWGATQPEIDAFSEEAMEGDYDHTLQTVMAWVTVL